MPKYFSALLSLMLLTSACQSEAPIAVDEGATSPAVADVESADTGLDDEIQDFSFSRETTVASGSSELADDSNYGFAYNAANVLDLDYSTSWCAGAEANPVLTLSFSEATELGTMGIVPGYARDEAIYFQNNRLMTLGVWYDDQVDPVTVLDFEDVYAMQFFTLPEGEVQNVKFKIIRTYPGSKYNDTCISEVDFWSDWVGTEDADAAYNYYLEYKEKFADRPVGISALSMGFFEYHDDYYLTACGKIDLSKIDAKTYESGMSQGITDYLSRETGEFLYSYNPKYHFWGTHNDYGAQWKNPLVLAKMNDWAKEGDLVTARWLEGESVVVTQDRELTQCDDGVYFSSSTYFQEPSLSGMYTVQLYYKDRFLGEAEFSLSAQ